MSRHICSILIVNTGCRVETLVPTPLLARACSARSSNGSSCCFIASSVCIGHIGLYDGMSLTFGLGRSRSSDLKRFSIWYCEGYDLRLGVK